MTERTRKKPDWVSLILGILMFIPWLLNAILHFLDYRYLFPVISSDFFIITVPNLLIPFIPAMLCGVFAFWGKVKHSRVLSLICLLAFLPLMLKCFFTCWDESWGTPTI